MALSVKDWIIGILRGQQSGRDTDLMEADAYRCLGVECALVDPNMPFRKTVAQCYKK